MFDVEMQGITYVVWGGGSCKASCALFGGSARFAEDRFLGVVCFSYLLNHPPRFKDPQEGLRGCFCWLGGDESHSLQSIVIVCISAFFAKHRLSFRVRGKVGGAACASWKKICRASDLVTVCMSAVFCANPFLVLRFPGVFWGLCETWSCSLRASDSPFFVVLLPEPSWTCGLVGPSTTLFAS